MKTVISAADSGEPLSRSGNHFLRFRELVCEKYGCSARSYDREIFWRSLHRRAFVRSAIVYAINPGFFAPEFTLIHALGEVDNYEDFRREILEYQRQLRSAEWALKAKWRMRLSGDRLVKLGFKIFHQQQDEPKRKFSERAALRFAESRPVVTH